MVALYHHAVSSVSVVEHYLCDEPKKWLYRQGHKTGIISQRLLNALKPPVSFLFGKQNWLKCFLVYKCAARNINLGEGTSDSPLCSCMSLYMCIYTYTKCKTFGRVVGGFETPIHHPRLHHCLHLNQALMSSRE